MFVCESDYLGRRFYTELLMQALDVCSDRAGFRIQYCRYFDRAETFCQHLHDKVFRFCKFASGTSGRFADFTESRTVSYIAADGCFVSEHSVFYVRREIEITQPAFEVTGVCFALGFTSEKFL